MTETSAMTDPMTLKVPGWLTTVVSTIAEGVLLVVTIGIITAMWLPGYLMNSRGHGISADQVHDDGAGAFPRGR